MERAINKIIALIEHFRLENLQAQTRCFYCGGAHKTVTCKSEKRAAFHLSITLLADAIKEYAEEFDQEQNLCRTNNCINPTAFNYYSGLDSIWHNEIQEGYTPYSRNMFWY